MNRFNFSYFKNTISNGDCYFAHSSQNREPELLSEHSALVVEYAKLLVTENGLNEIINKLILAAIPHELNKQLLAEIMNKLFWQAIAFHDFGKVNYDFQKNRMNNSDASLLKVNHSFQNQHSIISAYIFLGQYYQDSSGLELTGSEQDFLDAVSLYFSYTIINHHSSVLRNAQDDFLWNNEELFELEPYLEIFNIRISNIEGFHDLFKYASINDNGIFGQFNSLFDEENSFPLYALIKLNFSLLTASDYLATGHYMNSWSEMHSDLGIIDECLKNKIIKNAETVKSYNQQVYNALREGKEAAPENYTKQSNINLNELRKCIAMEVVSNVRNNFQKNLFYIEAPTGGGKTNVSMLALAELLHKNENDSITKIFYVFPFTTLITQTYQSLKETLGLSEGEITEIHSKSLFPSEKYDDDYLNYLDNLFMNYPVTLLSHIGFFSVLNTNRKETNYLLHRMANSVVIIDEIQSYPPKTWDKIVYFITNYAHYFNMRFIVMSATLPKIGDIIDNKELANNFEYLIRNKNLYFQNPNFSKRVEFNYELLDWTKPEQETKTNYLEDLNRFIEKKSQDYAETNILHPDSVFTIVEFIFKKTASEFYSLVKKENSFFDEVLILSGTILEVRRKEIINKIKNENRVNKKTLLISTQVVEAGVDIDMDLGFKDKSIIDSEEQLAGRINRNLHKPQSILYLFDCDTEKTLYGSDDRYKLKLKLDEYKNILRTKDFDRLYNMVIQKIKDKNNSQFIVNLSDLTRPIKTLDFKSVNDQLKIIDTENVSVFIPISLEIKYFEAYRDILKELDIPYNTEISGADVWAGYEAIIKNQEEDFVKNRIRMKKLQSLMSHFTISIFPNSKDYNELKTYSRDGILLYGYLYLENFDDIYSLYDGINTTELSESNFI